MKVLVTGAAGMLGQDVVVALREAGHEVTAAGRTDVDVTDATSLAAAVPGHDAVVNCAAHTAVDAAETDVAAAELLNTTAAGLLGAACAAAGARLVQVSTDYVFSGDADLDDDGAPLPYPEDAPVAPRSVYGRTKAAGEAAARAAQPDTLVVRTAWLYGAGGRCFPKTIARAARERGAVSVIHDQVGQPTWTVDVARIITDLLTVGAPAGAYHATSSGQTSWYGFTQAVLASAEIDPAVASPTTSAEYVLPAPRPAWSVLGHDALVAAGVTPIGDWADRWNAAAGVVLAS
ncbi:dTDP-4-dehydrorhamnose reductase [Quadrisphaera granulorum]|uniref:dTDP-4-dehydrorhamnose reductase n=1 Tax=Quadrisphaera granulorum TaxID=317664 RepID=A0A316AGF4_9ACTN|nr:dTDP-4-dehydrorhamnose reductase [Quadrisphaera granulorum]PWJ56030.1 dTDP-4-dehydrorhamnose reductase [Quadrisphaera granulorum]SZE94664.1 dTDP-4-dehydrorhamnose reductase [Quadrisphaera granulorum]